MAATRRNPRRRGQQLTETQRRKAQATFLEAFARCGTVLQAARDAGVSRSLVYAWRETDSDFAARYELAEADANDVIRGEIHRRAVEGWDEPVYQSGRQVGTIRRYSDTMLRLLAMSRMQEFRDKLDVTSDNEAINIHGITQIINDPTASAIACDLLDRLDRIGHTATPGSDASGTGADR